MNYIFKFLAAIVCCAMISCSDNQKDEPNYDIVTPMNILVEVVNTNGEDLLDINTPDNLWERSFSIDFMGTRYTTLREFSDIVTPPGFPLNKTATIYQPFAISPGEKIDILSDIVDLRDKSMIFIGQFDFNTEWKNEPIVFNWGDGKVDRIEYSEKTKFFNKPPYIARTISLTLNGVPVNYTTGVPTITRIVNNY